MYSILLCNNFSEKINFLFKDFNFFIFEIILLIIEFEFQNELKIVKILKGSRKPKQGERRLLRGTSNS